MFESIPTYGNIEGVLVIDFDDDGDADIFLCNYPGIGTSLSQPSPSNLTQRLLRNENGKFSDVSEKLGLAGSSCSGASAADLNGDGYQDIVTILGISPCIEKVYINMDGEYFEHSYSLENCPVFAGGPSVADVNGDGNLDVYITFGGDVGVNVDTFQESRFYFGTGNGSFVAVNNTGAEKGNFDCGTSFIDLDRDGDQDMILMGCNKVNSTKPLPTNLAFLLNDGKGNFSVGNDVLGIGERLGFWQGLAFGDVNGDERIDIYAGNRGCNPPETFCDYHALFLSQPDGTYVDIAPDMGIHDHEFNWGSAFIDVDNDGDVDLVTVGYFTFPPPNFPDARNHTLSNPGSLFENKLYDCGCKGKLGFEKRLNIIQAHTGIGLATGDFDEDGLDDIIVQRWGQEGIESAAAVLYHNEYANENDHDVNKFIKVRLHGKGNNQDGIGAQVVLTYKALGCANKTFEKRHLAKTHVSGASIWATHEKTLTFGLGRKGEAIKAVVYWSNGGKQVVKLKSGQTEVFIQQEI